MAEQGLRQGLGIVHNLSPIGFEFGGGGFLQRDRDSGRGMVMRSALQGWKHGTIDSVGVFGFTHDHGAAWATQRLMRGSHHRVGVGNWALMYPSNDQAGDMRDVRHKARSHLLSDIPESFEVELARIGR